MRLFRGLESAFWCTDQGNVFARTISRIKWDKIKREHDEWVFKLDDLTFTTPSLDPSECLHLWSPVVQLANGKLLFIFA